MNYVTLNVGLENNYYEVNVEVNVKKEEHGYDTIIRIHKTIEEENFAEYGKLLSLIEKHDIVFLYVVDEIKNHDHIEAHYQGLKITYVKDLMDLVSEPYIINYTKKLGC